MKYNNAEEVGFHNPTTTDCRPATTCSASLLNENISDAIADNRPSVLIVQSNINVNWDANQADCECLLNDSLCGNQSCWNTTGLLFAPGTTANCCGDDVTPGPDPTKNHEAWNFMQCGDTWDPLGVDTAVCENNVSDSACCPDVRDCVYKGQCYLDDLDVTIDQLPANPLLNMTCSNGVWCPLNFYFNMTYGLCKYGGPKACYSNDPSLPYTLKCQAQHATLEYWDDFWESPNPPPADNYDCINNATTPNDQCCCPWLDWQGALYYIIQDIDIY